MSHPDSPPRDPGAGAVRFLHTSDWQLGMRRRFLGEEAARFLQARIDAIRTIARVAREERCECIVVAGDVFESNQVDRTTVLRAMEALAEAPCPVFLLPANHDALEAASVWKSPAFLQRRPPSVRLLEGTEPLLVRPGFEIAGSPWTSKRPMRDLVAEAIARPPPPPGTVRVLVAHGGVDRLAPDRTDPALIGVDAAVRALDEGRIHYLALGDRHSVTEVHPRIWYSGAPEPTDFDETAAGEALVVDCSPERCAVERRPIGRWRFLSLDADLASAADVETFAARLRAIDAKERTVLKLSLRGTLSLAARARLDEAIGEMRALFASLELWERRTELAVAPDADDLARLPLSGFARAALDDLAARAREASPEAERARDALALLFRLAGGAP